MALEVPTSEKCKYTIASAASSGLQAEAQNQIGGVAAKKGAIGTAVKGANYAKHQAFVKNAINTSGRDSAEQEAYTYENSQTPNGEPLMEAVSYFQTQDTYCPSDNAIAPKKDLSGQAAVPEGLPPEDDPSRTNGVRDYGEH